MCPLSQEAASLASLTKWTHLTKGLPWTLSRTICWSLGGMRFLFCFVCLKLKNVQERLELKWHETPKNHLCKKHCQRHNGPEGWVHLAKVICWGPITSHITSSRFNFITSTKHQRQNAEQTPASKSCLNFNFKILTNPCAQSLNKSLALWPNVSFKSATNCCQHDAHHQHQQQ